MTFQLAPLTRLCLAFVLLLSFLTAYSIAGDAEPVHEGENQHAFVRPRPTSSSHRPLDPKSSSIPASGVFHDLHSALYTLQDQYFSLWLGKWTTAIDWTAAVTGTYVSATLLSLSRSIDYTMPGTFDKSRKLDVEAQMIENEVNKYFGQSIAFYYGEEAFAIRMQAFDDMLWVVSGWLESIQFIESHSSNHYASDGNRAGNWHAQQFTSAFAHRVRVFYELTEQGWDWRLCGGGMTWNPRLLPYKNAITNQLFISASISMYLYFPGDDNCSPFLSNHNHPKPSREDLPDEEQGDCCGDECSRGRYDPHFLTNAINGYDWLKNSGMQNSQGLYTDGFHIGGYRQNKSKTTCDERNEMVYTYNQGVVLSGLRDLWEATGNISYLEDGHELVHNVMKATGWKKSWLFFGNDVKEMGTDWHGLGFKGVLTELCDPSGTCNQNGQTFKGIFFHYLTAFCTPLPRRSMKPGKTYGASREVAMLHQRSCDAYISWVIHNAQAALGTRDEKGRFGGWWGSKMVAPETETREGFQATLNEDDENIAAPDTSEHVQAYLNEIKVKSTSLPRLPKNAIDYRNHPITLQHLDLDPDLPSGVMGPEAAAWHHQHLMATSRDAQDPNERGRGRTVETQGSGLAVVRAMYEFLRRKERSADVGGAEWVLFHVPRTSSAPSERQRAQLIYLRYLRDCFFNALGALYRRAVGIFIIVFLQAVLVVYYAKMRLVPSTKLLGRAMLAEWMSMVVWCVSLCLALWIWWEGLEWWVLWL